MSPLVGTEPSSLVRLGLPVVVLVGAMLLLPIGDVRGTGIAGPLAVGQTGPIPALLDLAVGQALLLAGTLAWLLGLRARVGTLAVLAGICWFGPDLFALVRADPLVRAVGRFILGPFLMPLLLHLVTAALRIDDRPAVRVGHAVLYVAAAIVALGAAVTYDAFFDPFCMDCAWDNPLLVGPGRGAVREWQLLGAGLALLVAVGAAGASIRWWAIGARTGAQAIVATSALGLGLASAMRATLLVLAPRADPLDERWVAAWIELILTCLILSVGVAALGVETWRRAARMRRIADSLEAAPAPGSLEAALGHALGDPTLRVAYRVGGGGLVDEGGAGVDLSAGASTTVTPVERDGERLAVVAHAPSVDVGALAAAFGPTVLVALDNERLRAARLAQLAELRASRARIVAVGDAERRRLERDLHDGVQQQLLAILFDVRLARLAAERSGDDRRATTLAEAEARAQDGVDELRRVAHGIHPAVLTRSGLIPALASLAEEAAIPLEVVAGVVERLPEAVEGAAYRVVAEAVTDGEENGASAISVAVAAGTAEPLRIEIRDDARRATEAPIVPMRIADRVGAAGGEATVEALPGGGRLLTVELPCG